MAVSKVLCIVLLGLFGAALANPVADTTTASTTTAATTTAGTGSTAPGLTGVQDYLSDADKEKVCKVIPTGPSFCAVAGPADEFCKNLAASVNGAAACCAANSVCSFKVGAANAPAGNGTTPGGAAAGSTTPVSTTTVTTTTAATTTTAGTGPTTPSGVAPAGLAPAGSAVIPQPNTVYVSCNTAPNGFKQLKTCATSKTIFVFPSAPGSPAGANPAAAGSTTTLSSGPITTTESD